MKLLTKLKNVGIIIILINILSICNVFGNWIELQSGVDENLNSVFAISEDTVYAVGDNGVILNTYDGGENWTISSSNTNEDLKSIAFLNRDTGFIVGENSTILKTTDGGQTWGDITLVKGFGLEEVNVVADSIVYMVGGNNLSNKGVFIVSKDYGKSWKVDSTSFSGSLYSAHILNEKIGYVLSENYNLISNILGSRIYKTTNLADSWEVVYESEMIIGFLYFLSENNGFCSRSSLYRTTIDDTKWSYIGYTDGRYLAMDFYNNTGYAVGYDLLAGPASILKTVDGGINWNYEDKYDYLIDVDIVNDTVAYTVGRNGTVLKLGKREPSVFIDDSKLDYTGFKLQEIDRNKFNLHLSNDIRTNFTLELYDLSGRCMSRMSSQVEIGEEIISLDFSNYNSGVYYLSVCVNNQKKCQKILIE